MIELKIRGYRQELTISQRTVKNILVTIRKIDDYFDCMSQDFRNAEEAFDWIKDLERFCNLREDFGDEAFEQFMYTALALTNPTSDYYFPEK